MANETDNVESPNDDTLIEVEETEDVDALREQNRRFADQNRQLFARAKKAEGFELKDGHWVKLEKVERKTEPYKPPEPKATPKSGDIDFAELAFHNTASDIRVTKDEDVELLRNYVKETGKPMKDILRSKWFQAELKERLESRTVQDAIPKGVRRAGDQTNVLDVEYAKYEQTGKLPDDFELRAQVVNRRIEKEKTAGMFTRNTVVEG